MMIRSHSVEGQASRIDERYLFSYVKIVVKLLQQKTTENIQIIFI